MIARHPMHRGRWAYDGTVELAGYVGAELLPHTWDKRPARSHKGSLVRFLLRTGRPVAAARDVVSAVESANRHEFWPDSVSFADVEMGRVVGHRQVTDVYLAQLARSRNGQLATLDSGLAHLHSDVAVLIPTAT